VKVASFEGEDAQTRLRREAQHASRLSHPHICQIYEVGRADGQLFVVMELLPGRSLADVLREGPLPVEQARRYGIEIADALAHAHESGLVHRDLKSTNVMITPKQGAKVLDFGLARMLDTHQIDALSQSQRSLTDAGLIAGTLPYMAPELLRGQRGDERVDIWALGVLLYEMFAGRRPFSGATGFELSAAILHQPPEAWPPDVPAPVRAIVQRCLEKKTADRYQHAAGVRLALEEMQAPAPAKSPRVRIPYIPRRLTAGVPWLVIGLAIAAIALYGLRSTRVGNAFSNAYGYSLLEDGSFGEAIDQFEGVTKQSPNEANPWDSLGEGYLASAMPDRALDAYARALAIEPANRASIRGRGLALAALGRYDEALERESPDFRNQAFLLSRVGRYREAMDVLDRGRRNDDDAEVNAGALLTSAWLFLEQKQYARALDDVRATETVLADERQASAPGARGAHRRCCRDSCRRREERGVAPFVAESASRQRQSRRSELDRVARRRDRARRGAVRSRDGALQGAAAGMANARARRVNRVRYQSAVARRPGARRDGTGQSCGRHRRVQTPDVGGRRQPIVCRARASVHPGAGASPERTRRPGGGSD
jgi:serine/threonine protein kinase